MLLVTLMAILASLGQFDREVTNVQFAVGRALVIGPGAKVSGRRLLVSEAGRYVLTGEYVGNLVIDAPGDHVTLVLDGVTITNPDGPAVLIASADAVTLELTGGTKNELSDGGESDYDAAIYSEAPLRITGRGSLTVNAAYEGISSTSDITIEGGSIAIHAGEDGLNASTDGTSRIKVNGGYLYIESDRGDGIDSNGTLEITGGTVIAYVDLGSGESGLDADGGITITGGTVLATATRAPIPLHTPGAQNALILDVLPVPRVGDLLVVSQPGGEQLLALEAVRRYYRLIFSSAKVVEGRTYDVYLGGSASGEPSNGLHDRVLDLGELAARVRPSMISLVGHGHPGVLPR